MFGFSKRRKKLIEDIAYKVIEQLEQKRGWKEFLPPVAMRDTVYLVTKDGEIYAMRYDHTNEMEMITKIRN